MSLLILFQGGTQGTPSQPPTPPVVFIPPDFLPHGLAAIGPGADGAIGASAGAADVGPGASTHTGDGAGTGIIGPGGTTTIQ